MTARGISALARSHLQPKFQLFDLDIVVFPFHLNSAVTVNVLCTLFRTMMEAL